MRTPPLLAAAALVALFSTNVQAQQSDIAALREAVDELRSDYEARIASLERRLAIAEQNSQQDKQSAAMSGTPAAPTAASTARSAAFNPAIGVIFQGQAWNFSKDPAGKSIPGFPLGGEAGPIDEGLAIAETELIFNANVDDKFSAWLTAALALEDGEAVVEVEEAWIDATALPAGLGAKFGRFFSGIGYLNEKHAHSWDFADQPLPYQAFLGDQYRDDGVQLRWLAPTDLYLEIGGEWLRGGRYPGAGAGRSGFGSHSVFARLGGDIGVNSSWLAGVSRLDAKAVDRASGDEEQPVFFNGDTRLTMAQFVWKWAPEGNWKQRNMVIQAEYLRRHESGSYVLSGATPLSYDAQQSGWYAQAVYQPIPRWRIGGRIDALSGDDPGSLFVGTELAASADDPMRYSVMADWSNSEFSRLRLQLTRNSSASVDDTEWGIQYIHSIGAHGAHAF